MLENSIFAILALFMIFGTLGMISFKQTIYSAFSFLLSMIALGGIFALLNNSFLFLAQIMVSVGAVVVLSLMVIVSINAKDENLPDEPHKIKWMLLSSFLVSPFVYLLYSALTTGSKSFEKSKDGYGSLKAMGETLFSDFVLPFEIVSILLLTAMLGAIVIAREDKKEDKQNG